MKQNDLHFLPHKNPAVLNELSFKLAELELRIYRLEQQIKQLAECRIK